MKTGDSLILLFIMVCGYSQFIRWFTLYSGGVLMYSLLILLTTLFWWYNSIIHCWHCLLLMMSIVSLLLFILLFDGIVVIFDIHCWWHYSIDNVLLCYCVIQWYSTMGLDGTDDRLMTIIRWWRQTVLLMYYSIIRWHYSFYVLIIRTDDVDNDNGIDDHSVIIVIPHSPDIVVLLPTTIVIPVLFLFHALPRYCYSGIHSTSGIRYSFDNIIRYYSTFIRYYCYSLLCDWYSWWCSWWWWARVIFGIPGILVWKILLMMMFVIRCWYCCSTEHDIPIGIDVYSIQWCVHSLFRHHYWPIVAKGMAW